MFCHHCGKELPPDARYCPDCGTAVSGEAGRADGTTDAHQKPNAEARPSVNSDTSEPLSVDCCYKAPGFLLADRIAGTLTLTKDALVFQQWGCRMVNTVLTLGLMSYSKGQGIGWNLSGIQSAALERGWRNATLKIRGKNGKEADFEILKSGKLVGFHEQLLLRIEKVGRVNPTIPAFHIRG